jgi:hypothetical protein
MNSFELHIDPSDFLNNISKAPKILKGWGNSFVQNISLEDVDRLFSISGLRPPFIALINGRTGLRTADYSVYYESACHCGSPSKIYNELIKEGTTIIIQHAHLLLPGVRVIVEYLSRLLHPLSFQTNCYLTPSNAQGVYPHIDQHHTFLLQVSGRKRWRIWRNIDEDPTSPMINVNMPSSYPIEVANSSEPIMDEWIEPGDFLVIPRGFVHTPFTSSSHSLHVTFGILDPGVASTAELLFRRFSNDMKFISLHDFDLNCIPTSDLDRQKFLRPLEYYNII